MNTPAEMIAAITAFEKGKPVQSKPWSAIHWHDDVHPYWNFQLLEFRPKPRVPRERFVYVNPDGLEWIDYSRGHAIPDGIECYRVVEVIEDEK